MKMCYLFYFLQQEFFYLFNHEILIVYCLKLISRTIRKLLLLNSMKVILFLRLHIIKTFKTIPGLGFLHKSKKK